MVEVEWGVVLDVKGVVVEDVFGVFERCFLDLGEKAISEFEDYEEEETDCG